MTNVWKNVTPPFHFDHLPTQVPKSPICLQNLKLARIFEEKKVRGLGFHIPICPKKAKEKVKVSCWSPFGNLNYRISKFNFLLRFRSFWDTQVFQVLVALPEKKKSRNLYSTFNHGLPEDHCYPVLTIKKKTWILKRSASKL